MQEKMNEFKAKLAELIEEYDVEICASDEWEDYPELGEDIQITVFICGREIGGIYHPDITEKFGSCITIERLKSNNK